MAERKLEKLMSAESKPFDLSKDVNPLEGTLLENRRYLLFGTGVDDDDDERKLKPTTTIHYEVLSE